MDHSSAQPMIEPIPARRRLMGQLAWPGPKSVLNDVESCVILTKLLLRAHEVQEDEDIPDISWQMDHSAQPMIELILAWQRLMDQLAWPEPKSVLNDVQSRAILKKCRPMKFKKMKKWITWLNQWLNQYKPGRDGLLQSLQQRQHNV